MLSENDKQNLLRNLSRNRVVLVTGAGFSVDAINRVGQRLPLAGALTRALWRFLYDSDYDEKTNLRTVYEAAKTHRKGRAAVRDFLQTQLHAEQIPEWYSSVAKWFWKRIYTFNVDDVLEQVYGGLAGPQLDIIVAPDHYQERDAFLRRIQYVKLHGSIDHDKELTLGMREYGTRAAHVDVWYLHFVEDYSMMPTLFVGTQLDEPLFWQYIELRGAQSERGAKPRRAKCFLVSPEISRPHEEVLTQYYIVPIRAEAHEFFKWLDEQAQAPSRETVLRTIDPTLEPALLASEHGAPAQDVEVIEYFYSIFRAPVKPVRVRDRASFLLGNKPSWEDIAARIDAHREINAVLKGALVSAVEDGAADLLALTSAAGGGKSTIAKRVATELADDGYSVFFSEGESRPDPEKVAAHLKTLQERAFLFFDGAGDDLWLITELWEGTRLLPNRPVIVVMARTNEMAYRGHNLYRAGKLYQEIAVPNLTNADIDGILATLEEHDLLGDLKAKTHSERVEVFRTKARKQILVAMREATSGRGFNEIIRDEFASVTPAEARLLYVLAAIASDGEYGLTLQQMITAMGLPPIETMALAEKSLAGILVPNEADPPKYFIRHPAIAHFILEAVPRELLSEGMVAFLTTLSAVLPAVGRERRLSRAFRVYRDAINHRRLHSLFLQRPDLVRKVYDEIRPLYRDDGHYWLQYASYEIEYGSEMDLAENHLKQAAALMPRNDQVDTATAHLLMKKAVEAPTAAAADSLQQDALKILRAQMGGSKTATLHPLHIFGSQMISYIRRWIAPRDQAQWFREVHEELRRAIPDYLRDHAELKRLLEDIKRAELTTVTRQ